MPARFPVLTIAAGKEIHLRNRHHAIFRNAVARFPDAEDGEIVEVRDASGGFLCYATLNRQAYICGRAIGFEEGDPLEILRQTIARAVRLREEFFRGEDTNAYRLVNAEGDGVPGLVVDRYGDVLVAQLTTLGMDRLRDWITDALGIAARPSASSRSPRAPPGRRRGSPHARRGSGAMPARRSPCGSGG